VQSAPLGNKILPGGGPEGSRKGVSGILESKRGPWVYDQTLVNGETEREGVDCVQTRKNNTSLSSEKVLGEAGGGRSSLSSRNTCDLLEKEHCEGGKNIATGIRPEGATFPALSRNKIKEMVWRTGVGTKAKKKKASGARLGVENRGGKKRSQKQ